MSVLYVVCDVIVFKRILDEDCLKNFLINHIVGYWIAYLNINYTSKKLQYVAR